jgi:hypothetical protein
MIGCGTASSRLKVIILGEASVGKTSMRQDYPVFSSSLMALCRHFTFEIKREPSDTVMSSPCPVDPQQ